MQWREGMKGIPLALAVLVMTSLACGGTGDVRELDRDAGVDAGSQPLPGKPPPPWRDSKSAASSLSDDVTRYLSARCKRMMACNPGTMGSEETCITGLAAYELACAPGLSTLRLPGLDACVSAWQTFDCALSVELGHNSIREYPAACEAANEQLSHANGLSLVGERCGGFTSCDPRYGCATGAGRCQVCLPRAAEGESCKAARCGAQLFCNQESVCERPRANGARCVSHGDCASLFCDTNAFVCAPFDCKSNGSCAPPAGLNEPCEKGLHCRVDGVCTNGCTVDAACVAGVCRPYAACQAGKLGDPCFSDYQCQTPLACDLSKARCSEAVKAGDKCGIALSCAAGYACDFEQDKDSTCTPRDPPSALGGGCHDDQDCKQGFCELETCVEKSICG